MAVTDRTLRLLAGLRIDLARTVDQATLDITRAWITAWNEVAPEWEAAIGELIAAGKDGKWPTRRQVLRAERAARALQVTREALDGLAAHAGVTITRTIPTVLELTETIHGQLLASQYPVQAGSTATVMAGFGKVNPDAIDAIVRRTTRQIESLNRPLARDAAAAMRSTLIRGVTLGENPRRAAARMLERVQGRFDGGRVRALVIARTEILDAHRAGALAADKANRDVLAGWEWIAQLDRRTCPSCWSQHGTRHALDEPGPLDHQQGRCARLPITKSWRQLGFDIDDPPSVVPDAQATFRALPRDDQLAVMGKARLDLLDSGDATWADLSQRRTTSGWRDSFAPTPVSALTP